LYPKEIDLWLRNGWRVGLVELVNFAEEDAIRNNEGKSSVMYTHAYFCKLNPPPDPIIPLSTTPETVVLAGAGPSSYADITYRLKGRK
jgi:hypothetical protein